MSVTDKFTKKVTFVPEKKSWSAIQWALTLLARLDLLDWGTPKVLISDRDRKFLSDLWAVILKKLGVELLYCEVFDPCNDALNNADEIELRKDIIVDLELTLTMKGLVDDKKTLLT